MKKLLAMVLALVMTLSLAVSASAVKADEKINEDYAEAVAVLNGMGVFKGYEDGSFKPENKITRAEVATIIYRIYTKDVAKNDKSGLYASYNKFTDMAGAGWAAGYIGYCANAELVKGYPDGTFKPSGNVTGYEVLAMILRAVGYDKNGEFTGADWALNVAKYAEQLKILENVAKTTDLSAPATRELVSEILFRAINVPMVTYTAAFGYQNVGLNGDTDNKLFKNNISLGKKNFDLEKNETADKFGRPTITWKYNTGDEETVIAVKPLATFTEPAKNCEVYDESGLAKDTKLDVYTNSAKKDGTYVIADNKDDSKQAMQGRLTEVYEDRVVNVDTYLAEVEKAVAEKTDAKGHVTKAYVLVDDIYGFEGKFDDKFVTSDEFKADDMVLVTVADGKIQSMVKAENKAATLTKIKGNYKTIDKVADVMGLDKEDVKTTNTAAYMGGLKVLALSSTYNFYFDTYGNVIGADELASNYAVLDSLYIDRLDGKRGVDGLFGTPYFFNGEKAEDVTIDEILGRDVSDKRIELTSAKNDDYYYTVYAYTIDKDGVYTFENSDFRTAESGSHSAGDKYITVYDRENNKLHLNKDSQILLQTKKSPSGTFVSYTGYEKLGNVALSNVQYKLDSLGYVTMLYAQAEEYSNRTVFVYDTTPAYSWVNDDGDKIATMKVLELVENEWKETTVDVYYGAQPAYGVGITLVGLYELTEGQDGLWYAASYAPAYSVDNTYGTKDNFRVDVTNVVTGKQEYLELDDAKIVKYTGSFVKGEYDTEDWEAKDLDTNSIIYVQFNDDDEVVAVYDMYVKYPVTVNGKETKDVEYWLKDFNDVTVTFDHKYEMISTIEMGQKDIDDFTVTYYNGDTKIGSDLDEKGTEVTKAVISYTGVVTDPIVITTTKQAAAAENLLNEGKCDVPGYAQDVIVYNTLSNDGYRTIWVSAADETFTVANLRTALEQALKCNFQKVEFFNTDFKTPVTNEDTQVASDMLVKVTSWDTSKTAEYQILVYNS